MSALDAPPKLDMSPIRQDTTPDEAAYAVFYLYVPWRTKRDVQYCRLSCTVSQARRRR